MKLEASKRLSESVLWNLQHLAYDQFGPDAWAHKGVPFYLTSNPLIAKQFSAVILGYIRDGIEQGAINLSEPLYIFDLGAGSGRLGFLILKHLIPMVSEIISPGLKICYVMTDMIESNIEMCKKHPFLEKYILSGNLDFALYHHAQQLPLKFVCSGKILENNTVINPVILICTYYFDTVPQDLFKAKSGRLEEGRISIAVSNQNSPSKVPDLSAEMIADLECFYDYIPIDNLNNYYPDRPEYNQLLEDYGKLFDNTPFLFPIGGLESLRFFSNLSNGRLLLLAGDQGVSTEEQVRVWGDPKICLHATFSMPVSYHLLAEYFHNRGGIGFLTSSPNPKYVVMCGIIGKNSKMFPNAKNAFYQEVDFFEPIEYFELTDLKEATLAEASLKSLLLYIKIGNWDPVNLNQFIPEILKKLPQATEQEKEFLYFTINRVWENFYPVNSDEGEFVMNLGVLLFQISKYQEALCFFQEALKLLGANSVLLKNIAICRSVIR